jgi:alkyldihydroxyacetonephosphate synthase
MGIARRQIRWNGWGWAAHQDALAARESVWRWLAGELGMPALLATPPRPLDDIALPVPKLTPDQIAGFTKILGTDRLAQDDCERAFHARGRSYDDLLRLRSGDLSSAPDAVLYPRGEDEVLAILELAAREKIGIVPFGGGTGLNGGVTAGPGSVTLDLSGMDQVLEVDSQSGTATAEAGITGPALEKALGARGLALGHLPESFEFSTLGGWIATNGMGQECGRYGAAADWLIGARLATPQGFLNIEASNDSNLASLVLGSQGALGVITQAKVKIRPVIAPLNRAFLFGDFAAGAAALHEAVREDIPHLMLRLSDAEETRLHRAFAELDKPRDLVQRLKEAWTPQPASGASLLLARFADAASARRFESLAKKHGAKALGEEPVQHWLKIRFLTPYGRDPMLDRGVGVDTLELTASWPSLAQRHAALRAALDKAMRDNSLYPGARGLVLCHIAHAGADRARLRFTLLFPRQLDNEVAQGRAIRAAAPGLEEDALGLAALRGVKAALDPENILNPGKLFS